MSIEFVKQRYGASHLDVAKRQQQQLSHFTQSSVQKEVTQEYLKAWAERNYAGSDYFLSFVKSIFRNSNFLSFFKYLRYPLPSAKLINDEIKPQLKRVYFADDSFFKYVIKNKEVQSPPELNDAEFETTLFDAILFNGNDILVHDLDDINSPYRDLVCIKNIVSIESHKSKISRVAYKANTTYNGIVYEGYLYLDKNHYVFYKSDYTVLLDIPHDLGECPACWVSNEAFSTDNDIVRKLLFSYVREELEEFVFLKTLLKMTEPNGAIPVTVKLKATTVSRNGNDLKGESAKQPFSSTEITSQRAGYGNETTASEGSFMQTGSITEIPLVRDEKGMLNTDVVQNYAKQFYVPTECLEYMKTRIYEIERSIIANALGDYQQNNDSAKNTDQIAASMNSKQDKLRSLGRNISWVRNQSDFMLLALKYGRDNVSVNTFAGSDFFLDNESEIYTLLASAPNPVERKNLITRLGKTKYRFNKEQSERQAILYSLLPFASDKDFATAIASQIVDDPTKLLQLRFEYWISMFEARFGDLLIFYYNLDASNSEKLITINNILMEMIKELAVIPVKELQTVS